MSTPSPAGVRGGRVVRLLGRHRVWTSASLTADEAEALACRVIGELADIGDGPQLLFFRCGDGREVAVRARDLMAVEHQACTEAPRPARTAEEIADAVVQL